MRVLAGLVLTAIALTSGCGDPDLAEGSAPPDVDSLPTVASTSPDDTVRPGATDSTGTVAPSTPAPAPESTAASLVTEPPQAASVTTASADGTPAPIAPATTAAPPCVGASMQWAPPLPSDAWQQFVLEAAPTGTCGVTTVLMMSLVIPESADAPGTLVTLVSVPAELAAPRAGTPIEIDGRPATVRASVGTNGEPATTIIAQFGDVVIDAHGYVDEATLRQVVTSIRQLDDAAWAELVAGVETG